MPLYTPGAVPIGAIILWSGTIATIPTGYSLCDGTSNSPGPDLRDQFVVGARQDSASKAMTNLTGSLTQSGAASVSAHSLTTNVGVGAPALTTNVQIAAHTLTTNVNVTVSEATATYSAGTSTTHTYATSSVPGVAITQPVVSGHVITQPVVGAPAVTQPVVGAHSSVWPAYYALAYIQRMS